METTEENQKSPTNGEEERKETRTPTKLVSHLSITIMASLFVLGVFQFQLDGLNGFLVDFLFRIRPAVGPHPDIVLVAYDEPSASISLDTAKIPADELVRVFDTLTIGKPKAVALIASINERLYSDSELHYMASSFARIPHTLVGYIDDQSLGKVSPIQMFRAAKYLPGFISRDNFSYGRDSVSRRVMIRIDGIPTVYSELARIYKDQREIPEIRHVHPYGDSGTEQVFINWQGPPGTYKTYSLRDVIHGNIPPVIFADKIVLIGRALVSQYSEDFVLTPYSRSPTETTALEGAAHSLSTLMDNSPIFKPPPWLNVSLSLLIGILTTNMVLFLSPITGMLFIFLEIVFLFFVSWFALAFFNCWINLAHPFIVACFGYYVVIPYRLVNEYRKRWHYQNKSEMMVQLEQLKSNFLSLVSHDLKTPIARIQSYAELLLHDSETSSPEQQKKMTAIVSTAESLGQYVQTILDITRIDNARVPLQLASRDINATIKSIIKNKSLAAEEKQIALEAKLEPIFSFRFDADLIRRVISNLVENAIKYSPEGSHIIVKSGEEDNWVKVSVSDEGAGIPPEEHENIFSKFYRCQNEATKQAKGTGLGLYLVKYFVELHKGFVELQSTPGQGSTFTVALPTV